MPPVAPFLARLRSAARLGRVRVSAKAVDEARADLEWDHGTILEVVCGLQADDFERTERSTARPSDVIWVFCPEYDEGTLWIRIVEREGFVVISFHLAGDP